MADDTDSTDMREIFEDALNFLSWFMLDKHKAPHIGFTLTMFANNDDTCLTGSTTTHRETLMMLRAVIKRLEEKAGPDRKYSTKIGEYEDIDTDTGLPIQ